MSETLRSCEWERTLPGREPRPSGIGSGFSTLGTMESRTDGAGAGAGTIGGGGWSVGSRWSAYTEAVRWCATEGAFEGATDGATDGARGAEGAGEGVLEGATDGAFDGALDGAAECPDATDGGATDAGRPRDATLGA